MNNPNPLKLLSRRDKWYLGGGNRLIWAPPFPIWLDYPGFWDKAGYYNLDLEPLFTWTVLDESGREIPLGAVERNWNPSRLTSRFVVRGWGFGRSNQVKPRTGNLEPRLDITEEKC